MKLAKIFSKGVVLQRNKPIRVFGTGEGEVSVTFLGDTVTAVSQNGEWLAELPAHKEGGPYTMTVCMNGETVEIADVWVGEVWIAAGQSNMSFMFWEMYKRGVAITDFDTDPHIHYFETVLDNKLGFNESGSGWFECTVANIMERYSILPYYFAAKLYKKLKGVHVAVLNASRGWTRIESWIPAKYIDGTELDIDKSLKNIAPASDIPNGVLFEGHVRPFVPFVTNGVVWYQGESNHGIKETQYYSRLLQLLIASWRAEFNEELPFLIVQLTAYGDSMRREMSIEEKSNADQNSKMVSFAKIREQQLKATQNTKNAFMVTTIDTGEFYQIHPTGKDIIAERLAIAASNIIKGENNEYSGPVFESMRIEGDRAIISFSHTEGLYAEEQLDWLALCGEDGIYYPAKHQVVNNELIVYSEKVNAPKNVKYAFSNWATGGIYNSAGFPASPFCTEQK